MHQSRTKELIAGIFFLMGILFVIFAVFVLGGKTGLGETKYNLEVVFGDIGGLRVGAPVRVAGVTVGSVIDIKFIDNPQKPDKRVRVTLNILSKYKPVVDKCSIVLIKTEGLLGDKLVDIQLPMTGQAYELPKSGKYIIGQDPIDIKNLADDFSETTRYFIYLSRKMSAMVEEINKISVTTKRVIDRIEDRIIEGGLMNVLVGKEK